MKSTKGNDIQAVAADCRHGQSCSTSSAHRRLGAFLMSLGLTGAAVAALCCMAPFLIAGVLAVVGLGFLLNESVLMGLLAVFLATTGAGYYLLRRNRAR